MIENMHDENVYIPSGKVGKVVNWSTCIDSSVLAVKRWRTIVKLHDLYVGYTRQPSLLARAAASFLLSKVR